MSEKKRKDIGEERERKREREREREYTRAQAGFNVPKVRVKKEGERQREEVTLLQFKPSNKCSNIPTVLISSWYIQ